MAPRDEPSPDVPPEPTTSGGPGRGGHAPAAGSDLHPGPMLRRGWWFVASTGLVVALIALPLLPVLPPSSTARVQVVVTGPESDPVFGASSGPSSEEQLQRLLVELESPATVGAAAELAGVPAEDVEVAAVTERDALVAEVGVTTPDDATALAIAGAIPELVTAARRAGIAERSSEVAAELREQAEDILEQAAAQQAEIARAPLQRTPEVFLREQRRDGLLAQYERLLTRAAEIELESPTRAVGLAVSSPPELAPGSFPPPIEQALVLIVLVGLLAGAGLVLARAAVLGRLQREQFAGEATGRHLGVVTLARGREEVADLAGSAARLRALPELDDPAGRLVAIYAVGLDAAATWKVTTALGGALAESGFDVAALAIAYGEDATPVDHRDGWQPDTMWIDVDEVGAKAAVSGHCQLLRARRFGGSALAAVYCEAMQEELKRHRDDHDVLLLDPTGSGLDGWLEATMRPDLAVLLVAEDVASRSAYEDVRLRLDRAGVASTSLVVDVEGRLRAWSARVRRAVSRRPAIEDPRPPEAPVRAPAPDTADVS